MGLGRINVESVFVDCSFCRGLVFYNASVEVCDLNVSEKTTGEDWTEWDQNVQIVGRPPYSLPNDFCQGDYCCLNYYVFFYRCSSVCSLGLWKLLPSVAVSSHLSLHAPKRCAVLSSLIMVFIVLCVCVCLSAGIQESCFHALPVVM